MIFFGQFITLSRTVWLCNYTFFLAVFEQKKKPKQYISLVQVPRRWGFYVDDLEPDHLWAHIIWRF